MKAKLIIYCEGTIPEQHIPFQIPEQNSSSFIKKLTKLIKQCKKQSEDY